MKTVIGFIIVFLILYFGWKIIKRLILKKIFKTLNNFPQNQQSYGEGKNTQSQKPKKEFKKDIKWDAETIDFEEIPDKK